MLGDVRGRATVLTTQCQALQQAQTDQDDRRGHADAGVVGQHAHDEGRQTHDQDGHQEGVFATDHVAQTAEHKRAERTHDETGGKCQQREDESRAFVQTAEELFRNDRGERSVQVEVIPFKNGAQRRGKNHLLLFRRHRAGCCCSHVLSPKKSLRNGNLARFLGMALTFF